MLRKNVNEQDIWWPVNLWLLPLVSICRITVILKIITLVFFTYVQKWISWFTLLHVIFSRYAKGTCAEA